METEEYDGVLDQHKKVNQLEFKLEPKENERDQIEDEIESVENRLDQRDQIEVCREDITAELTRLRTQIDQIEADAVEAFNEHMENLRMTLEYDNLDRIWIDRTSREVRGGVESFRSHRSTSKSFAVPTTARPTRTLSIT